MTLQHVDILFQVIAFAISVHESAHAWMANRCGDPTARMLGRITLNPIKHIDLFGTILLPLIALWTHMPLLGWAKPTPVDPRNFQHPVRDDIFTSVVGPVSNFLVASGAILVLIIVKNSSTLGRAVIAGQVPINSMSPLVPFCLLIYELMVINVVLAVFNLIPIPPLDGSHVLRHFLPEGARRIYDAAGWFALMALVFFAPNVLGAMLNPVINIFRYILGSL